MKTAFLVCTFLLKEWTFVDVRERRKERGEFIALGQKGEGGKEVEGTWWPSYSVFVLCLGRWDDHTRYTKAKASRPSKTKIVKSNRENRFMIPTLFCYKLSNLPFYITKILNKFKFPVSVLSSLATESPKIGLGLENTQSLAHYCILLVNSFWLTFCKHKAQKWDSK